MPTGTLMFKNFRDTISPILVDRSTLESNVDYIFNEMLEESGVGDMVAELYYFKDPVYRWDYAGTTNTVVILVNTINTQHKAGTVSPHDMISTDQFGKLLIPDESTQFAPKIKYSGVVVAEVRLALSDMNDIKSNILNILFDVFAREWQMNEFNAFFREIFKQYFDIIKGKVIAGETYKTCYDKDEYKQMVAGLMTKYLASRQKEYMQKINQYDSEIQRYKQYLMDTYKNRQSVWLKLQPTEMLIEEHVKKIKNEIDLIMSNEKVEDLSIKNQSIHIFTKALPIYDTEGNCYFGGKYRIEIDFQDGNVRFFNLSGTRKGFWSDRDNHPHVNNRGAACLGNVDATIVTLLSDMELYPLSTILINFLEAANEDDPAGRNVVNWDGYNEETGEIIPAEENRLYIAWYYNEDEDEDEDREYCENCEEYYDSGDMVTIYERVIIHEDGERETSRSSFRVCEQCASDDYCWDDVLDVYYNELEDKREECERCNEPTDEADLYDAYEWVVVNEDAEIIEWSDIEKMCSSCAEYNGYLWNEREAVYILEYRVVEEEEEDQYGI